MLCELFKFDSFLLTWLVLFQLAVSVIFLMSGAVFIYYYVYPTYEKWVYKDNPKYPQPDKVREEIILSMKGAWVTVLNTAQSFYLMEKGFNHAYCGVEPHGWSWLFWNSLVIIQGTDFFEFYYHRMGHKIEFFWVHHKQHHLFYNPTPFAVVADDLADQYIRGLCMFIIPLVMPTNMDQMSIIYFVQFYGYGVFIHCGHEFTWLSAHNYWINTPYQHYIHHAKGRFLKPYHTGFLLKTWDRMFGSFYDQKCICCRCEKAAGKRTIEIWNTIEKPDYSVLLNWEFWKDPEAFEKNRIHSVTPTKQDAQKYKFE